MSVNKTHDKGTAYFCPLSYSGQRVISVEYLQLLLKLTRDVFDLYMFLRKQSPSDQHNIILGKKMYPSVDYKILRYGHKATSH